MAKHAYHDNLTGIPLFSGLDDDELDLVAQAATELSFPAGRVLMREGDVAHEMFVVVSGTLEVTRKGQHVANIESGGFAGEIALLTHHHRTSTVTCATECTVLHIDGRVFSTVIEEAPGIAAKMIPVMASRMAENADLH
ncbi:MAG: hypothetical protein CL424_08745 [Acidimicrobiaceae bacterium]|nr:hypothetical protein [Acidimicrobiaceae bacterium]